jgi:hypothetical protein
VADVVIDIRQLNFSATRLAARSLPALAALAACVGGPACAADSHATLIDPTQPPPGYGATQAGAASGPGATLPPPDPVRLQMIAHSGGLHLAVVNGRSVHAGDSLTVGGKSLTIVAIGDDSIVLQQDGQRRTLELAPRTGPRPDCAANASNRPPCRNDLHGATR